MSLVLSVDTSSSLCSLELKSNGRTLARSEFSPGRKLSSVLVPEIERVFYRSNKKPEDIDVTGVCTGPGIFTGIRVGLATMKGLFYGKQVPVVPVTSLECFAYNVSPKESSIVSIMDARRGFVYAAIYSGDEDGRELVEKRGPDYLTADDLKDYVPKHDVFVITGPGIDIYGEYLKKEFEEINTIESSLSLAGTLADIALLKFQNGSFERGMENVFPLYLKRPDAEEKK